MATILNAWAATLSIGSIASPATGWLARRIAHDFLETVKRGSRAGKAGAQAGLRPPAVAGREVLPQHPVRPRPVRTRRPEPGVVEFPVFPARTGRHRVPVPGDQRRDR